MPIFEPIIRGLKNLFDVWMNLVDQVGKEQQSGRKAESPPYRKKNSQLNSSKKGVLCQLCPAVSGISMGRGGAGYSVIPFANLYNGPESDNCLHLPLTN